MMGDPVLRAYHTTGDFPMSLWDWSPEHVLEIRVSAANLLNWCDIAEGHQVERDPTIWDRYVDDALSIADDTPAFGMNAILPGPSSDDTRTMPYLPDRAVWTAIVLYLAGLATASLLAGLR